MIALIVVLIVIAILAIAVIVLYNNLVQLRNRVDNAWSQIDVQLQRRLLTGTLKSLFAVAEAYPDLKANTNFQQLQAELTNTEDKISYMRQSYNDTVLNYNNAIQTFPGNIIAGMFHFTKRDGFDANAAAAGAPVVSFGQGNAEGTPSVNFSTAPTDPPQAPSLDSKE